MDLNQPSIIFVGNTNGDVLGMRMDTGEIVPTHMKIDPVLKVVDPAPVKTTTRIRDSLYSLVSRGEKKSSK